MHHESTKHQTWNAQSINGAYNVHAITLLSHNNKFQYHIREGAKFIGLHQGQRDRRGAECFWEEKNDGANTFSGEKNDGADTFLGKKMTGLGLLYRKRTTGRRLLWNEFVQFS